MSNDKIASTKPANLFIIWLLIVVLASNPVVPVHAQQPGTVTMVVDDPDYAYSGTWYHYNDQTGAYLNTMSAANSSGAFAEFTFTGSSVILYSRTWNNRGKMAVYLDGSLSAIVDLYSVNWINQVPVYTATVAQGQHTIRVEWTGDHNPSSSDTAITLDKISYTSGAFIVDDPSFTYTGAWEHYTNQTGAYLNTMSAVNTSGAYATYTFNGSAMTIYSRTWNNRGKMAVYLDDVLLSIVDLYSVNWANQVPVYSKTFSYGQHTVKVEWTGEENAGSSGTVIVLDKLTYIGDAPPTPTPTQTNTPTNTPTATNTPTSTPTITNTPTLTFTPSNTPTSTATTPTPRSNGIGTCWDSGPSWPGYSVSYVIDTSIPTSWINSIDTAANAWTNVNPSPFSFVNSSQSSYEVSLGSVADYDTPAYTWFSYTGSTLTDVYLIFNDDRTFDTSNPASASSFNLQNLAMHEFGHWLELEHVNATCLPAIMFGGISTGEANKTLATADENGINWQYP